jgi:hypothetical protein
MKAKLLYIIVVLAFLAFLIGISQARADELPRTCVYTSEGWGYFEWVGNLGSGGYVFIPCSPPTYILVTPTPTPKGKTK